MKSMNPIFTFVKQIKAPSVTKKDIPDDSTISKILLVLGKLESQPRAITSNVDEIGLRTNPKTWVKSLLSQYPNRFLPTNAEALLFDFTDSMQTRMRMESKYALALLTENRLFMCHSVYGQKTITPDWEIIPRMLDIDNVLRFASFFIDDGALYVRYWEREATSSFIEWLGLPRKQAFLFGGKYRIISRVEGAILELQLTEKEIDLWLQAHPELREGKVDFSTPINGLIVDEIRAGQKHYDHPEDFIQDFEAEKRGIPKYQREYERLNSNLLPLLIEYYDEKTQLVTVQVGEINIEVEKTTPGFEILFANGIIKFRASYITELAKRILNGDEVSICHAGHDFRSDPYEIGRVRIYNKLKVNSIAQAIIEYIQTINLQDAELDAIIRITALQALALSNEDTPIDYCASELARMMLTELGISGNLTKLEDDVIEYKSRDVFTGSNKEIISVLSEDLRQKMKLSNLSILLVGVEDGGGIDPIPNSRLQSDRLESIRKGLASEIESNNIAIFPIPSDNGSILLISAHKS